MGKIFLSSMFGFFLLLPLGAQASDAKITYSPQAVDTALAKGCAVFLEFSATW